MPENKYLLEAIAIGEDILANSLTDDKGIFWEVPGRDESRELVLTTYSSLYDGNAGILLFLLSLYRTTRNEKYVDYLVKGASWTYHFAMSEQDNNATLYGGKLGVAYVLINIGRECNNVQLVNQGRELAMSITTDPPLTSTADILLGQAGILKGCLLLYDLLKEQWLLPAICNSIQQLLSSFTIGNKGIFWEKEACHITGLCGFAHGNAGIGLALIETGKYFGINTLVETGLLAFQYENNHYDKKWRNWPDYRKGIYSNEDQEMFIAAYRTADKDYFTTPANMTAWCHGAPGVLLARYRAIQLLGENAICTDNNISAVSKLEILATAFNIDTNYTLCHGAMAFGLVFLEQYQYSKNDHYRQLAAGIADRCIESHQQHGTYLPGSNARLLPDLSLFNGTAGIGFYYLLMANKVRIADLLCFPPHHPGKRTAHHFSAAFTCRSTAYLLYQKIFPRTVEVLQTLNITIPEPDFGKYCKENVTRWLSKELLAVVRATTNNQTLTEILKLETATAALPLREGNYSFIKARALAWAETAESITRLDRQAFSALTLVKDPTLKTFKCKWDWSLPLPADNITLKPDHFYRVIQARTDDIKDIGISFIAYAIIREKAGISVRECAERITGQLDITDASPDEITNFIIDQVHGLVTTGLVTVS